MEHHVTVTELEESPADIDVRKESQSQLLAHIAGVTNLLSIDVSIKLFLRENPANHEEFISEHKALADKFEKDLVNLAVSYFGSDNVMTEDDLIALSEHLREYAHGMVGLKPPESVGDGIE